MNVNWDPAQLCNGKFGFKVRALLEYSFLFNKSRLIRSGRLCPIQWAYFCWTSSKTLVTPALWIRISRSRTFKNSLEIDCLTSTRPFRVPDEPQPLIEWCNRVPHPQHGLHIAQRHLLSKNTTILVVVHTSTDELGLVTEALASPIEAYNQGYIYRSHVLMSLS